MPAAELEYTKQWTAQVTQQTDITVLGENFTPDAVQADKLITVKVSQAELKQCVGYESNWNPLIDDATGEQKLPDVVLRLEAAVGAKLNRVHESLISLTQESANNRTFEDDVGNDISAFSRVFLQEVLFEDSVFDTQIPKVAIRSIDEKQAEAYQLATITEDITTVGKTLVDPVTVALHSLFEQAVAANRVRSEGAVDITGVSGFKSVDFELGDSVTVYVDYTFKKKRIYSVDTDVSNISGNNVAASIVTLSIGGNVFTINQAEVEDSIPLVKRYAIKLLADAGASKWNASA
jgi:hypothetical protein